MTDATGATRSADTRRRWNRPTWLENRMIAGLVMVLGFIVLLWMLVALVFRLFLPDVPVPAPLPPY